MRPTADLIAYVSLTLLVLWSAADRYAPYHGAQSSCKIGYVYDGDTLELLCDGQRLTARLQGFDAPEVKSPRCPAEAAWGARATERLRKLVVAPDVSVFRVGYEKYGRDLVVITVGGRDVADVMISEDLAVAYSGGTRRNWCD